MGLPMKGLTMTGAMARGPQLLLSEVPACLENTSWWLLARGKPGLS